MEKTRANETEKEREVEKSRPTMSLMVMCHRLILGQTELIEKR